MSFYNRRSYAIAHFTSARHDRIGAESGQSTSEERQDSKLPFWIRVIGQSLPGQLSPPAVRFDYAGS